ncbi:arsenic resistance N-acetyltransferase ArsN2 [Saccharophagus sp. K07]|uniref:arsenic resistance N-acetyltransferase ArsN2 n=1 Tax=Saccharophagus sp. K07 TaxID=2283636 RepID=UPI0016527AC0|nr:arsenic resistance N-acetyltransferase ArsN2 [Saccharophagus sp. K07]
MHDIHRPTKTDALSLLNAANLPTSDLTEAHMDYFWAVKEQQEIIAVIGLEPFSPYGLLRSLVVRPNKRNQNIGTRLVRHVENMARQMDIRELYLFTSTAQEFFEKFDYNTVLRHTAPDAIRQTTEFALLRPNNAVLMKKDLR